MSHPWNPNGFANMHDSNTPDYISSTFTLHSCGDYPSVRDTYYNAWHKNGRFHRNKKPARMWERSTLESDDGDEWWVNGEFIAQTYDIKKWAHDLDIDVFNMTDDDWNMLLLTFKK